MLNTRNMDKKIVELIAGAKYEGKNVADAIGMTDGSITCYKSRGTLHNLDFWKVATIADLAGYRIVFVEKKEKIM